MVLSRQQKLTIPLLLLYWPAIFILTHIPLTYVPPWVIQADVSDKTLHCLAYFVLVFLLWSAISPHRKVNWRRATVWWVLFVVVWYGVFDEWLQSYVGRNADVMDFFADLAGTLAAFIMLSIFSFWHAALILTGTFIFAATNLTRANMAEVLPTASAVFNLFGYGFFSILWVEYIRRFIQVSAAEVKWLKIALVLPAALLLTVRLFSVIFGRGFRLTDTVVAATGIGIVVATYYITAFFRCKIAKKSLFS